MKVRPALRQGGGKDNESGCEDGVRYRLEKGGEEGLPVRREPAENGGGSRKGATW